MSSRLAGRAPGLPASAVLFCRASPLGPGVPELELLLVERLRDGVGALLPGVSPAGLRQDRKTALVPPSFCSSGHLQNPRDRVPTWEGQAGWPDSCSAAAVAAVAG